MKNLISSFSVPNLKKIKQKDFKKNRSIFKFNTVHHRRDLDSLEDYIQLK